MEVYFEDVVENVANAATLFNTIATDGIPLEGLSLEELKDKITRQFGIAKEEVKETKDAYFENDLIEIYDGAIDSLYTVEPLIEMLELYCLGTGIESETELSCHFGLDFFGLLKDYEELPLEDLNLNLLNKCADLIIENNQQKFTTSKEEFDSWESEFIRKELIVDGVKYYTLVDENGKIRKKDGFKSVDLSFILDDE